MALGAGAGTAEGALMMRYVIVALTAIFIALLWLAPFHPDGYRPGFITTGIAGSDWRPVVTVSPEAARLGIRPGDEVDFGALPVWRTGGLAPYGYVFHTTVRRGTHVRSVDVPATVVVPNARRGWTDWARRILGTLMLLVGGYIGLRRPSLMTLLLLIFAAGTSTAHGALLQFAIRWPEPLYFATWIVIELVYDIAPFAALPMFAVRLPDGHPRGTQLKWVRAIDAICIAQIIVTIPWAALGWRHLNDYSSVSNIVSGALVLIAATTAYLCSPFKERGRAALVFAALVASALFTGMCLAIESILGFSTPLVISFLAYAVPLALIPSALAYAILKHHIFDVAFVINKASVFTITSVAILVVLSAFEYLLERFADRYSHAENVAAQFVIGLCVIFAVKPIHARVDAFMDRLFFHDRHEQETKLRHFAAEAGNYDNPQSLMADTVRALQKFALVESVSIYRALGNALHPAYSTVTGPQRDIPADDAALMRLRDKRGEIDIHHVQTAFCGVRVFPMILAGRLAGAVAVGERESGEEMPPDIGSAVELVVESTALSLEAIETEKIREENERLRSRLGAATT